MSKIWPANKLDLAMDNLLHRIEEVLSFQNSIQHNLKLSFLENIV